jgi:HPt (histidine-containing phosphotransfer) domain-containing protein
MAGMEQQSYLVVVDKDLEDLIPVFMSNRKKELEALRIALASADFDQRRQLGHRMKGVGNSYGFAQVSEIGKYVEEGARSGDRAALESTIAQYDDFLAKVQITYE